MQRDAMSAWRIDMSKERNQSNSMNLWEDPGPADLCDLDKRTLFVISDYFSNYIEVARVQ